MLAANVGDKRRTDVAKEFSLDTRNFRYLAHIQTEMSQKQFSEQALAQGPYPGKKYNIWILLM